MYIQRTFAESWLYWDAMITWHTISYMITRHVPWQHGAYNTLLRTILVLNMYEQVHVAQLFFQTMRYSKSKTKGSVTLQYINCTGRFQRSFVTTKKPMINPIEIGPYVTHRLGGCDLIALYFFILTSALKWPRQLTSLGCRGSLDENKKNTNKRNQAGLLLTGHNPSHVKWTGHQISND